MQGSTLLLIQLAQQRTRNKYHVCTIFLYIEWLWGVNKNIVADLGIILTFYDYGELVTVKFSLY